MKNFKFGFTLAEVLITLAIIGVVAALTIPTLMTNYEKHVVETRLAKVYATMINAFNQAKATHGDYNSWEMTPTTDAVANIENFWEKYIFPQLNISEKCFPITENCFSTDAKFLDGTKATGSIRGGFVLNTGEHVGTWMTNSGSHVQFYIDLNGQKGPNVMGRDIFAMMFFPNSKKGQGYKTVNDKGELIDSSIISQHPDIGFTQEWTNASIEDLLNPNFIFTYQASYGLEKEKVACSKDSWGLMCGTVIKLNNWKIPKGYPW